MRDFLLFCFFLARLLMYVGAHVNVGMANSFIYKIGKYKEKRAKDVDTSRMVSVSAFIPCIIQKKAVTAD